MAPANALNFLTSSMDSARLDKLRILALGSLANPENQNGVNLGRDGLKHKIYNPRLLAS